jgi:hypothetical protein
MTDTNAVIAVYDNHSAAGDAVKELQTSRLRHEEVASRGEGG